MVDTPRFSIIVPAHNEQELLARGLDAIWIAVARSARTAEIVVVANRCTDRTEPIAADLGARVVVDPHRNLSLTRNAGVAASSGEVVVTIDADSVMHPDALVEVERKLDTGRYVGGGCAFVPERTSLGLKCSLAIVRASARLGRVGGVMFWCTRADFDAIGGFDPSLLLAEDLDFARRLRMHGRRTGRRFVDVKRAPVTVSTRKFDTFGDWHGFAVMLQLPTMYRSLKGTDTRFVDRYFYDYNT